MDLWNKLGGGASAEDRRQKGPMSEVELDRKYGLGGQTLSGQMSEQKTEQSQNRVSVIQSNVKVDDADIPPFLRRKFNK